MFTNRTSLELKSLFVLFLFLFFVFLIRVSKLGVGLINGCGLYMDFYGRFVLKEVFLERETNVFALDRHKRFLVCET